MKEIMRLKGEEDGQLVINSETAEGRKIFICPGCGKTKTFRTSDIDYMKKALLPGVICTWKCDHCRRVLLTIQGDTNH